MSDAYKWPIPEGTEVSTCKGCGLAIYWIKTKKGKNMPVDPDGVCHFVTCEKAENFRKKSEQKS